MKKLALILALLLPALCLAGYMDLLSIGWVGQDSITAVESSRFSDVSGALALFKRSLMQDTGFIFRYYRPVTALSFGLNHLFCGAEAFGYHLVDLAILAGIGLCVYAMGIRMPRRAAHPLYIRLSAFAAALVFAAHTVHLTVLPVVARRSEGQLVLFGFAGLYFTLRACRTGGGSRILHAGLAVLLLGLATLSKEAGILFYPPAVLLAAFSLRTRSMKRTLLTFLGIGLLIGLLGIGLMLLRGGVIDVPASHSIRMSGEGLFKTTWNYLLTLCYPVRFLGLDGTFGGRWFPAFLAGLSILALGWALIIVLAPQNGILRTLLLIAGAVASAGFLIGLVSGAARTPVDAGAARDAVWDQAALAAGPVLAAACAVLGLLTMAAAGKRLMIRGDGASPSDMAAVLSAWLFCAWFIVTITGLYSYRNSLGPAAAFCLLLLLAFDRLREFLFSPARRAARTFAGLGAAAVVLTALSLVAFGHPLQRYTEWKDLDRIATAYLEGIIEAAEKDGLGGVDEIGLEGVPGRCFFTDRFDKSVALAPFRDYTMRSWFKMRLPEAPPVRLLNQRRLEDPKERVRIASRREGRMLILSGVYD